MLTDWRQKIAEWSCQVGWIIERLLLSTVPLDLASNLIQWKYISNLKDIWLTTVYILINCPWQSFLFYMCRWYVIFSPFFFISRPRPMDLRFCVLIAMETKKRSISQVQWPLTLMTWHREQDGRSFWKAWQTRDTSGLVWFYSYTVTVAAASFKLEIRLCAK